MLLIYLSKHTERSDFILKHIFELHLGISYVTTSDKNEFISHKEEKICYDNERFSDDFFIKTSGLLTDDSLRVWDVCPGELNGIQILFSNEGCNLGFDIFSASFYLLSRYEEYLPFKEDKLGRFPATESLAFKYGFINVPIVEIWVIYFKKRLAEKFPNLKFSSTKHFNAILTYDIDIAYKFKGRNVLRFLGSTFKDLLKGDFKNIAQRIPILIGIKKDNWDVYDELQHSLQKSKFPSIFFFLVGNPSKYDRNLRAESPLMKKLIKKVSAFGEIGIHPSFSSNQNSEQLKVEKEKLENITERKIIKSRQHFLKLKFPDTYSNLIALGIKEDYTMGFPEMPGFRAGTCMPFYFYDLKKERKFDLLIYPISCMEATFKYYLNLSPENSLAVIKNIIDSIRKVNGNFISIWHNDNLEKTQSDKNWAWCHHEMIQYLKSFK